MSNNAKLSSVVRYFVLSMVPPAGEATVVKRKKGYISFLHAENAEKLAIRMATKNPGTRFYVTESLSGHFLPAAVTLQSTNY